MSESLFGTYWYRVAKLKPFLRDATEISRHVYRGEKWYVLRNSLNGRSHRLNAAAYYLVGRMDGQRTVEELWENVCERLVENAPTQDEVIRLLGRLHDADLIQSDILPSTVAMLREHNGKNSKGIKQQFSNPFSLRLPLFNPDRFLEKWKFLTSPLFTRPALILWLSIVFAGVVTVLLNWPELSGNLSDKLLSMSNLMLLWLVYPFVKIFHEFGHAFAVKKWGGEVREMGIIFLALTPIPYVDATASASLPEKRHRMSVAAVGMAVELFLASIALFVWLHVETGIISAIAYNVMLIGGISTILFNGNPLLRYDGYYILSDLIEIPNLNQRAGKYLGYLIKRYLLRIETAESPVTATSEKKWFIIYGPASFCYRMIVLTGLVLFVSSKFFIIGILIALWGAFSLFILPFVRTLSRFLNNPAVRSQRTRLTLVGGSVAVAALLFFFILPITHWTNTQGIIWLPEQSVIRAGTDFEVEEILISAGQFVEKDTPLIRGTDPFVMSEIEVCKAQLKERYAMYHAQPLHERVKRKMLLEEIDVAKKELHQIEERIKKLLLSSPVQGRFILTDHQNLPGRFVKKGEVLGYILSEHRPTIRAVVSQSDIGLVRSRITGVTVRLAEKLATPLPAKIERLVPSADLNLPTAALGINGGGNIPVDPTDPKGMRALESFFQVDISLPQKVEHPHIGGRVYVRFEHGGLPLALQWYRTMRQLFMRKFYA